MKTTQLSTNRLYCGRQSTHFHMQQITASLYVLLTLANSVDKCTLFLFVRLYFWRSKNVLLDLVNQMNEYNSNDDNNQAEYFRIRRFNGESTLAQWKRMVVIRPIDIIRYNRYISEASRDSGHFLIRKEYLKGPRHS